MRYVVERYKQERREMAYRIYVTDCMRALVGNEENRRYADIIADVDAPIKPQKSADDIISDIRKKLGGENGNNGF